MASYQELRVLFDDSDLMEKVEVAVVIAAQNLVNGTPTAQDSVWAAAALSDPLSEAKKALKSVLAENSTASVAAIQGATDAAIQTNVDSVVPVLVTALSGV